MGSPLSRTITRIPEGLRRGRRPFSRNGRIQVLTYHAVLPSYDQWKKVPSAEAWYALTAAQFEAQMQFLSNEGFATALLTEFLDGKAPQKSVVLTFDDGHESNFRIAVPILLRFGFRAEFFVTVSSLGQPGFMNWEDLNRISDMGMSVQSHGLHHRALTNLSDNELYDELRSSKELLEEKLGKQVKYLAVPGGFINQRVYREALLARYAAVCNSESRLARKSRIISRIAIAHSISQHTFESLVRRESWSLLRVKAQREFGKGGKALLGVRRYEILKRWALRNCASLER